METDPTGFFEYDSITNEERKSIILEKIEGDIKEVKKLREKPISDKEAFKLIGKQDALERFKIKINSIRENSIHLVDSTSRTLGTPQHLSTDNKFLNAAYFQAMIIRDERRGHDGSMASSPEGEIGKREAMSEIMAHIKYLENKGKRLEARQNLILAHFSRLTLTPLQQALCQSVPVVHHSDQGVHIFQVLISRRSDSMVLRFR